MSKTLRQKDYKIYKFDYAVSDSKENWRRAQEFSKFKHALIDRFAPENYSQILENYTHFSSKRIAEHGLPEAECEPFEKWAYKGWMFDAMEIGLDMLWEFCGVINNQQRAFYLYVPLTRPDIIEWFEANKPEWTKIVKRERFPLYAIYGE